MNSIYLARVTCVFEINIPSAGYIQNVSRPECTVLCKYWAGVVCNKTVYLIYRSRHK